MIMNTRTCPTCKEEKPLTKEFFIPRHNVPSGFRGGECRACDTIKQRERRHIKTYGTPPPEAKTLPEELEGKAYISSHGNLRYLECIDCGEPKTKTSNVSPRCYSCGCLHGQGHHKYNREGFRTCKTCKEEKPLTEKFFYNSNGTFQSGDCIVCRKEKIKAYNKTQRAKQKQKANWNKKMSDPVYRLRNQVSKSIHKALMRTGNSKRGESVMEHLPYTIEELKAHLENHFDDTMTWENYGCGEGKWNIDHVYPQSRLPYDNMKHPNFLECWKLENLRPLCSIENSSKGNKID
jgi:hypothetical protein